MRTVVVISTQIVFLVWRMALRCSRFHSLSISLVFMPILYGTIDYR
jgi:hypothetical protein